MNATFTKDVTFDVQIDYTIKATSDVANFDSKNSRLERVTFSGKKLEDSRDSFSEAVGFSLTIEQMLEVIFSDVKAFEDFNSGVRVHPDSAAKDIFSKAFGKFILQDYRHWPVGGDPQEYTDQYFKDLNEKAVGLGYVMTDDEHYLFQ